VPSGETSIYVNLRKSMNLTEGQQGDMLYMMSLTEDEVPDVEDMEWVTLEWKMYKIGSVSRHIFKMYQVTKTLLKSGLGLLKSE
jgi:hypothetical protein